MLSSCVWIMVRKSFWYVEAKKHLPCFPESRNPLMYRIQVPPRLVIGSFKKQLVFWMKIGNLPMKMGSSPCKLNTSPLKNNRAQKGPESGVRVVFQLATATVFQQRAGKLRRSHDQHLSCPCASYHPFYLTNLIIQHARNILCKQGLQKEVKNKMIETTTWNVSHAFPSVRECAEEIVRILRT